MWKTQNPIVFIRILLISCVLTAQGETNSAITHTCNFDTVLNHLVYDRFSEKVSKHLLSYTNTSLNLISISVFLLTRYLLPVAIDFMN